jgi:hypothetical protein
MNCPECGTRVEKTDHFCPKCFAHIEPPSLWRRVFSVFQNLSKPGPHVFTLNLNKKVTIKTVGRDGTRREYHSLAEAPLDLQQAVEKMQSELEQGKGDSISVELPPEASGNTTRRKFFTKQSVSVFKIRDAKGQEQTYHSLEELPPEIRAAYEKAMKKAD